MDIATLFLMGRKVGGKIKEMVSPKGSVLPPIRFNIYTNGWTYDTNHLAITVQDQDFDSVELRLEKGER